MKSQTVGKNTSEVEVSNISLHGLWLYVKGKEYFLPYAEYFWFKEAKIKDVFNVKLLYGRHLYWPSLDVDLEISSLENPERYPLFFC